MHNYAISYCHLLVPLPCGYYKVCYLVFSISFLSVLTANLTAYASALLPNFHRVILDVTAHIITVAALSRFYVTHG